jgi:hypothetical protein
MFGTPPFDPHRPSPRILLSPEPHDVCLRRRRGSASALAAYSGALETLGLEWGHAPVHELALSDRAILLRAPDAFAAAAAQPVRFTVFGRTSAMNRQS